MSLILLVDDDEDMLAMTGRWLEKAGHEVKRASSGKAALSFLSEQKPDLILLDYAMPEMDGPAVLAEIQKREDCADIPVLYRTGMEDCGTDGQTQGPRPYGIIPKSEGKPYLIKAVTEALEKRG